METVTYQKDEKIMSALCYFPFFSVVICAFSLIKKPGSSLVIYHIKSALALFALWFVGLFVFAIMPLFGSFTYLIFLAGNVYGAYLGFTGKMNYIPVATWLGKFIPAEKIYTILTGKPYPGIQASAPVAASAIAAAIAQPVAQPEAPASAEASPAPAATQPTEQK
ncbi:MAG: hypothetical protein UT33_C0006G0062 [Candidatus Peregrinibacteria bacterium GW2011_GWC2_39_14]|nr:MAG: hypothetical protein UT33_C0006G0062 [Candidatus Peregrinibacteria bacterium GW2011_GWC2_39_14]